MKTELYISGERMAGDIRKTTIEDCLAFTEMLFRVALRMTHSPEAAEALTLRTIQDIADGRRWCARATSCLKGRLLTQLRSNFIHGVGRNF